MYIYIYVYYIYTSPSMHTFVIILSMRQDLKPQTKTGSLYMTCKESWCGYSVSTRIHQIH